MAHWHNIYQAWRDSNADHDMAARNASKEMGIKPYKYPQRGLPAGRNRHGMYRKQH
tara:strand:- start:469 stop:636 length:168 start_codon:yes stop_codon:yes gene_type:complete